MTNTLTNSDDPYWMFRGDGVSARTARAVNWGETSLGSPAGWPIELTTTLAIIFGTRQPMFLFWGQDLVQFYNDAYLPSFGIGKHPQAMGQVGASCWQEIWPIISPQIDDVMKHGTASWNEDALVPIFRNGRIEEVYWTYTYSPVFLRDGTVGGVLVVCTETTKRVLGERRMSTLKTLVGDTSMAPDATTLLSKTFRAIGKDNLDVPFAGLYAMKASSRSLVAAAAFGMSTSEAQLLGQQVPDSWLAQTSRVAFRMTAREAPSISAVGLGTAQAREVYVVPLSTESGQEVPFIILGISPWLPFDESYVYFLAQVTAQIEVSRSRIAEAARREALEMERRNLLEQAPVATALMIGPTHVFELANPLFRHMVGRPDIVGKSFFDAFPESGAAILSDVLDGVYQRGESFVTPEFAVPIDKGQGTEVCFFTFNLEPVRNAEGDVYGMMAIAVEITEQVRGRRALERTQAEREELVRSLELANRAKDEFLAMLGHELRNPLSPIVTALALSRRKTGGTVTREHQIIERQVGHLVRLVDDLLDVAKIARGKVELRRENVDIFEVVAKAIEMASDLLEQRNHRLSVECPRGRFIGSVDPVRLSQTVANLLTNAAKYTDRNGLISVEVGESAEDVVISVTDNGSGIPPDVLPRIFELFERGERTADAGRGGLGIGLALVKNFVALHGGSVSAQSRGLGQGSTFRIQLPLIKVAVAKVNDAPSAQPRAANAKRVLVVDDNLDAAELLCAVLQDVGHDVEMVSDPVAALDLAMRFAPEIALLDIGLPVMDGYELAARLKATVQGSECRLIALTGYGQDHDRERSRLAGFDQHLVKPVDVDHLIGILGTVSAAIDDDRRKAKATSEVAAGLPIVPRVEAP